MSQKNNWQKKQNLVRHSMRDNSDRQQENQPHQKMYNWVVKQPHQHKMDGDPHKKK